MKQGSKGGSLKPGASKNCGGKGGIRRTPMAGKAIMKPR